MLEVENDLPAHISEWAESCRRFVKEAMKLELDYTPDTLPLLDHYVRSHAQATSDEVVALLTPPLGAYFGEVVRHNFEGARWHAPSNLFEAHRIEFDGFFLHFNPLGIAHEVLTGSDSEGWGAHFQMLDEARPAVAAMLEHHDSVTADDYYSFSIRYETLESVTAVLIGLESKFSAQPRRFGRDVYRAAGGELGKGSLS
jgi:hypothetical protein